MKYVHTYKTKKEVGGRVSDKFREHPNNIISESVRIRFPCTLPTSSYFSYIDLLNTR